MRIKGIEMLGFKRIGGLKRAKHDESKKRSFIHKIPLDMMPIQTLNQIKDSYLLKHLLANTFFTSPQLCNFLDPYSSRS
jgi:hypothetical protein